jgi:hypothetical protein
MIHNNEFTIKGLRPAALDFVAMNIVMVIASLEPSLNHWQCKTNNIVHDDILYHFIRYISL